MSTPSTPESLRELAAVTPNATTALELRVQALELEVAALKISAAAAKPAAAKTPAKTKGSTGARKR